MRKIFFFISLVLLISSQAHGYGYVKSTKKTGYVEVGMGATQFELADDIYSEYDLSPSLNFKLLFAGRIGRSQHAWFEFNYSYNGAFQIIDTSATDDEETTYRSQSIGMGVKLTTAPHKPMSAFLRLGGGRIMLEERTETFTANTSTLLGNVYDRYLTNQAYVGLGTQFSMGRDTRFGFEVQQMQYEILDTTFTDNAFMMTLTRYLK